MYSNIEEQNGDIQKYIMQSYLSTSTIASKNQLEKLKLNVVVIGEGDKIINQYPVKGTTV